MIPLTNNYCRCTSTISIGFVSEDQWMYLGNLSCESSRPFWSLNFPPKSSASIAITNPVLSSIDMVKTKFLTLVSIDFKLNLFMILIC